MGRCAILNCIFALRRPNNFALSKSDNLSLLEKSFSPKDWEYLAHNAIFQRLLADRNDTLDDFESLVSKGTLLLKQRDELKG